MPAPERSVLHVLPHPGGGGETYVDLLASMPGYRFDHAYLAPSATPSPSSLRGGLIKAMRRARHYDLLHVHGEVAAGLCLPLLATSRSVLTLHGLNLVRRVDGVRRLAATVNLRAVLRTADRTICVSQTEHDYLTAAVGSRAAQRALVIQNGVRVPETVSYTERAQVRNELGVPQSAPLGIWVASLDEHKDPLLAVRAAERCPVTLLLAGDGPLRSQVERTGRLVRVLGHRADIPRLLTGADFFVLTSHREAGPAFALLEAMAHGLPAVAPDLPENRHGVGDTGIVVSPRNEDALVAALRWFCENERERVALGRRARQRVVELFRAEEMIGQTRTVYDHVLGAAPCPRA
jgi:glycosyltransferase involved in cell wall biosynthesis